MSMNSPNLQLPLIAPSQAMKHVTHNEAIVRLDAITQLSVVALGQNVPPQIPSEGGCYGVGSEAQGEWLNCDGEIALYSNGGWQFMTPQAGWRIWNLQTEQLQVFSGGNWLAIDPSFDNVAGVGVNTESDAVNRLSVSSEASLFNHEGAGHQLKINKAAQGDTASLMFQSEFNGHAEIGLAGENDLSFKVSDDGGTFTTAMRARAIDGMVEVPCLRSGRISIEPDNVASIPTPSSGGMMLLSLVESDYPQVQHSGIFSYDVGATLSFFPLVMGGGIAPEGDTVLSGTTGQSGKTNIAVQTGAILIENRRNGMTHYAYTFINAF